MQSELCVVHLLLVICAKDAVSARKMWKIVILCNLLSALSTARPLVNLGDTDNNQELSIENINNIKISFDLVTAFILFILVIAVWGLHSKYKRLFLELSTSVNNLRCQLNNHVSKNKRKQSQL